MRELMRRAAKAEGAGDVYRAMAVLFLRRRRI